MGIRVYNTIVAYKKSRDLNIIAFGLKIKEYKKEKKRKKKEKKRSIDVNLFQ